MQRVLMEKEKTILISVIVPIYNAELYLEKCLNSIIGQTYRHLEIILIDDGSTDKSGAMCDRFAAADDRIKVIHRKNGGISAARNSGLDIATGDYFGFADSDDWLEPDMYQFLLDDLANACADIAVCGFFRANDHIEVPNDRSRTRRVLKQDDALELLLQDRLLQNYYWCKLYKRELFDGIRMPEGKTFEDAFTQHLIFEKARRVVLHNIPKYHYRLRDDSISGLSEGFLNKDCHEGFYERVRYFFTKGQMRFCRPAAITYLKALCVTYLNAGDVQTRAAQRQRYAVFCRKFGNGRFLRPWEKFFYDFIFSGIPGALLFFLIYRKCRISKKVIMEEGPGAFYRRAAKAISRLHLS
jgi:glycosyltransferase involved in cell wall biosynthesis